MAADTFTFDDAGSICVESFLIRERRADEVRAANHAQEAARTSGVHFSGMEHGSFRPRSEAEQRAAAHAAYERVKAFGASPRGRLLNALRELDIAYGAEAEKVRGCYSRGFSDPARPPCPRSVGLAIQTLAPINLSVAREAIAALAEILLQHEPKAA